MHRTAFVLLLVVAPGCSCAGPSPTAAPSATAAPTEGVAPREGAAPSARNDEATAALCAAFLEGRDPQLAEMGLEGGCAAAGAGVWQLETEVTATKCDPDWNFGRWSGRARLVFRAIDGATAALPWQELRGCEGETAFRMVTHYDWDGDGFEELVLEVIERRFEDGSIEARVLRFDGDAIAPYAPADPFTQGLVDARDVDEDGRPDLISTLPLQRPELGWSADGGASNAAPVLVLWHALPDGTFTRTDAVARAFLREQCPTPGLDARYFSATDLEVVAEESGETGARPAVICARLRGVGVDALRRALEGELRDVPCADPLREDCYTTYVVSELIEMATQLDMSVRLD